MPTLITSREKLHSPLDYLILAIAFLIALLTLVWLLNYSRYGIDFTDESYYLIWMSAPWNYSVSASQFGFIYHPLYLLFQGDIVLLRQANILIIFGLAWLLCIVFFRATIYNISKSLTWISLPFLAIAAAVATCSLVYFCPHGWLATPSYNSLIFQALLLSSIGLLLAEKSISWVSINGWLLIGVGGWLAFMAKPTSAAALVFVVVAFLLLSKKFNSYLVIIAVATSTVLLIVSAWVIDGSLAIFFERLRGGFETYRLLEAGHNNMFRINKLFMKNREMYYLAFSTVASFGIIFMAASKRKARVLTGTVFTLFLTIICTFIISGTLYFPGSEYRIYYLSGLTLAVPLSAWAYYFVFMRKQPYFKMTRNHWGILLLFAVLPHVSAFGSLHNYWFQGSMQSLFWVLAGLIIFMPVISIHGNWRLLLPVVIVGQIITVFLLQVAMEQPYWAQPEPFRLYDTSLSYGKNNSELILPKSLVEYSQNIKRMATQAGFQPGDPVIDLTGAGPGSLYAIGAKAIGQAWMIGGFPGSYNLAVAMLNRASCKDIAEAWLLIDPDSRLKLPPEILNNFGLSFEENYALAAELKISSANVARHGVPSQSLQLWKPTHHRTQTTITACENL